MINRVHAKFYRPERGWDPVPGHHAQQYADHEWRNVNEKLLDTLEAWLGTYSGKQVLDLGAGPGHYAVAFALRGAQVTWYDVSHNYLRIAQQKAREHAVDIEFVLGYMDEAPHNLRTQYDLVFNRGCFAYGWSDQSFVEVIVRLVKPGGWGYIDANNSLYMRDRLSLRARLVTWLNQYLGIKIGHPNPPRGRIAKLLLRYQLSQLIIDYNTPPMDRILFRKAE